MNQVAEVDLAIILVNFRTPSLLVECLSRLLPEVENTSTAVVIVDNDSQDGSVAAIDEWVHARGARQVRLLSSRTNLGFAGGNNMGIRSVFAKFYLLLNSDAQPHAGAISCLMRAAEVHVRAGILSPRLEWSDGQPQQSCFRFRTPLSEFLQAARTGVLDRLFGKHVVAMPVQHDVISPDWTSFACVLIRRELFDQVGLLDDGYFMYFEDEDFCYRARQGGWSVLHEPRARVVHLRGGSSPVKRLSAERKRLPRYFHESRTRFLYKIHGRGGLVLANLLWWAGRMVSVLRQLTGSPSHAAIESQWRDIWINWWDPLAPYTRPE